METKVNYVAVGAFVLLLGTLLIAGVLWIASGGAWQKKYDLYLAVEDESVAGLNLNAPVKLNGVDVGKVQSIALDHANPERVNLIFALEQGTPIKEDTVAVLKTQGLTGIAYVELTGGTRQSAPLRTQAGSPYPVIQTKPSLSARLENILGTTLTKLDSISANLNAVLSDENRAAFSAMLHDLAAVSHTVAGRKAEIDTGLRDAAAGMKGMAPLVERITRAANSIDTMGREVANTSVSAGKTVDVVGAGVKRLSSETMPELERLLGELTVLSSSLRRLTEQTERDPRSLLFGRKQLPLGPGETKP